MLTRLLRLLFVRPAEPPVDRERWHLAEGLDSLVKDAKPRRTLLWVVPPIIHPDVARKYAAVVATGVGGQVVFRDGDFREGYGETVKSGHYLPARGVKLPVAQPV